MTTSSSERAVAVPAEEAGRPARRRLGPRLVGRWTPRRRLMLCAQVLLALVILGAWQWLGSSSEVQALTVSTPVDVLKWVGQWMSGEEGHGWDDLAVTIQEAALGWVLGVVVGVVLAVILASSKWLQLFGAPFVSILNALPKIALAPLFILIFGASLESKIYFVTAGIFFITFYNVFGGIRSIDPLLVRNARVLGASRLWLAREVYTPAIVGWLMTSLRLTSAWALTSAVVAEYLGAVQGMGYVVAAGQQNSQVEQVLGGVLVVAVVALVIDRILVLIEGHFARWRKS